MNYRSPTAAKPAGKLVKIADKPDCCLCVPIEIGVRFIFFLIILNLVANIWNIFYQALSGQLFSLLQILVLLPALYTTFYIVRWLAQDSFAHRYKISQGLKCNFIVNIFSNLLTFILVITLIDYLLDEEQIKKNLVEQGYYVEVLESSEAA